MKIFLINQTFYPDRVSTSQHLTDLAVELSARGNDVSVLAGNRGYDDPTLVFPEREEYCGVRIQRMLYRPAGKKSSKMSRAASFASFHAGLLPRLLAMPRPDVMMALTSPPLVAYTAGLAAKLRGVPFVYWVMDLNPDEAIAAGWLDGRSAYGRTLLRFSRKAFARSRRIVALDRFMKDRIEKNYGVPSSRIDVMPPWAHDEHLRPVEASENTFRREQGLEGKFVVMYSGNHSPCHPLDTMLEAARRLREDPGVVFYFIGGGSLVKTVTEFKRSHSLANIRQLPYQPIEKLSESLSAGDLHVTVMGGPFVGIVHPCKVYGILAVGRPFIFVGPEQSHLGDLVRGSGLGRRVEAGDADGFCEAVAAARKLTEAEKNDIRRRSTRFKDEHYGQRRLCSALADRLEGAGG